MQSPRPLLRLVISGVVLILFFTWAAWYVTTHWQDFRPVFQVPWTSLLLLYGIYLAALYFSGLYTKYNMLAFGLNLSATECFILSIGTSAANYMTFLRGGAGLRAIYFKTRHSFPLMDFISSLTALYLIQCLVNGFLGLIGLGMLMYNGLPFDKPFAIFFTGSVVIGTLAIFSGVRMKSYPKFPLKQISHVINGCSMLKQQPRALAFFIGVTFGYFLVVALQSKIAFGTYGVNLSWGSVVFYTAGQIPVSFANLTPGALGIQEAFTIYMGRAFQYDTTQAMMVQALIRFVSLTTLVVLGPLAIVWMSRRKPSQNR